MQWRIFFSLWLITIPLLRTIPYTTIVKLTGPIIYDPLFHFRINSRFGKIDMGLSKNWVLPLRSAWLLVPCTTLWPRTLSDIPCDHTLGQLSWPDQSHISASRSLSSEAGSEASSHDAKRWQNECTSGHGGSLSGNSFCAMLFSVWYR